MNEFGVIILGPFATKQKVVDALMKVQLLVGEVCPEIRMQWQPSGIVGIKEKVEQLMGMKVGDLNV